MKFPKKSLTQQAMPIWQLPLTKTAFIEQQILYAKPTAKLPHKRRFTTNARQPL